MVLGQNKCHVLSENVRRVSKSNEGPSYMVCWTHFFFQDIFTWNRRNTFTTLFYAKLQVPEPKSMCVRIGPCDLMLSVSRSSLLITSKKESLSRTTLSFARYNSSPCCRSVCPKTNPRRSLSRGQVKDLWVPLPRWHLLDEKERRWPLRPELLVILSSWS